MTNEDLVTNITKWLGTGSINIFGRPFSGKDTQAKKLAVMLGGEVIGGGEILRSTAADSIKEVTGTGLLAPQDEYLKIVLPYFSQEKYRGKSLILSSVGRWHGEEEGVIEALKSSGHELKAVIALDIDESEVRKRWEAARSSGDRGRRTDDAHGALGVRLSEFWNKTLPVLETYRSMGLLIEINGANPPADVTNEIIEKLAKLAKG